MDTEKHGLDDAMRAIAEAAPRRFYATRPSPCPYLPGRLERTVFTELTGPEADGLHDLLAVNGFRRNQGIAYRPFCESCTACVAVRVRVAEFRSKKWMRRVNSRNADLEMITRPPKATVEQYQLFARYLEARHFDGGMADMSFEEYRTMIEETSVSTEVIEFRDQSGELVAACLVDTLGDGLSLIYSFFTPSQPKASYGSAVILKLIERAKAEQREHVYLGYWSAESQTRAYNARFEPIEALGPNGWQVLSRG